MELCEIAKPLTEASAHVNIIQQWNYIDTESAMGQNE
jgi:hypothetical protein